MTFSYDELQYESYSYSLTNPAHLATVGTLFGLKPQDHKKSRVLELGCASGGNIIPLACNFPKSEFIGIDLSQKQIDHGQQLIDDLGIKNISLHCQSIADFEDEGQFDYIVCHGVYTWVPEDIRQKILSIIKQTLAPQGIACISYNALPAWNMATVVRDMMKFHVRHFKTPEERVKQSRVLINFLSGGLEKEKTPYAKFLKDELSIISKSDDYYIYHEYLEEENQPFYFHEFVKDCKSHQLNYLSDSHVPSMFPGNLKKNFSEKLSEIKDIVRMGQYMDFIRNQRFRTTLICHESQTINRNLDLSDVHQFYLSFCGQFQEGLPEDKIQSNETVTFQAKGIVLTIQNPLTKACMKILHDGFGKPLAYDDLVSQSMKMVQFDDKEKAQAILDQELNLIRLYLGGMIQLHMDSGIYASHIDAKPMTAKHIQTISKLKAKVPNLRHETHHLQDMERIVLQFLDGDKKIKDLNQLIEEKIKSKELSLKDDKGVDVTKVSEIRKKIKILVLSTLESLLKKAYLLKST